MCLRGFIAWAYKCNYRRLYHVKIGTIKEYMRDINRYYNDTDGLSDYVRSAS